MSIEVREPSNDIKFPAAGFGKGEVHDRPIKALPEGVCHGAIRM
jgi:hypothetical protein